MILRARGGLHGINRKELDVFPETPDKITLEPMVTRTYGEIVVHTYGPTGTR
jgi:hypothetical protein